MMTRRSIVLGGAGLAVVGARAAYAVVRDMGSLEEYGASVAVTRATLTQTPEFGELLRYATLAPSGHNTQPWTFRADGNRIAIFPNLARRTPIVDPDDHHLFVSLGCAAENLILASAARDRSSELSFDPANEGSVVFEFSRGSVSPSVLFDATPSASRRATTTSANRSATPICGLWPPRRPFWASISS